MKLRLAAPDALRSQATTLVGRLTALGFAPSVVDAGDDAELRLVTAVGRSDVPSGRAAIVLLAEPRDALVTGPEGAASLSELPDAARVAVAGSLRAEMLGVHRADLRDVRVEDDREAADLLRRDRVEAWITPVGVARASGLSDVVREVFEPTSWATAVGRGTAVLLTDSDDGTLAEAVSGLDDPAARAALEAERTVLDVLGVDPEAPVGVMARPHGPLLRVRALVPAREGMRLVRADFSGRLDDPETAGRKVAEQLIARGGLDLLQAAASS